MALFTTPRATFTDLTARTSRIAETSGDVPAENWTNGGNDASCSGAGVGYAFIDPEDGPQGVNLTGSPEQFTLLDQMNPAGAGDPRTPQVSQSIGGVALLKGLAGYGTQPVEGVTNPTQSTIDADPATDGKVTVAGAATLTTLAAGWVVTP
jgi:hypothetical protein